MRIQALSEELIVDTRHGRHSTGSEPPRGTAHGLASVGPAPRRKG